MEFNVTVVRVAGKDIFGQHVERATESIVVVANDWYEAKNIATARTSISFCGCEARFLRDDGTQILFRG